MSTNEGWVYFALDGEDFDPDELSQYLGMRPTSIVRKGSRIPGESPVPKVSSWKVSTERVKDDYLDIYDLSKDVVARLLPKKAEIIQAMSRYGLSSRLEVVLHIAMNDEISTPAIGFDAETVTFISDVGAYIDIDTYRS